jgi:hypothetical protein
MAGDLSRENRLQIMLAAEEWKALDDWRFAKRMPSRAAAIRELLKRGLEAEGFKTADGDAKSQDFGVVDRQAKK